ncbi:MAG: NAD(P)/FAD-dependent oxidoreductase [Clostridia bacterium]
MSNRYDLLIVGGGIMASSIACNLLKDGYTGRIALFEQDRTYEFASTPRSEGGIRQMFTTEVNIRLSQYSMQVYKQFEQEMALDGEDIRIDLKQHGYLFLVDDTTLPPFLEKLDFQRSLGVDVQVLTQDELKTMIPELNVADVSAGIFSPEDGYMDPYSVLQAYIKKAKRMGAEYKYQKVARIQSDGLRQISGVVLESGEEYFAPIVINASGAWSGEISKTVGIDIPVRPLRRQVYSIQTAVPFQKPLPFIFDRSGIHFRSEGPKINVGLAKDVPYGFEFHWEKDFFLEEIWPRLAARSAHFEKLKLERGWAGVYDYNYIDHNAIIGGHPELNGYYMVTGFSGHGFQQAPAAGKAMSELIRLGRYETIDLAALSIERFARNELVLETAVL